MKNKGFTLVELLAVITVLGIIAIITVPNIINILNDSKDSLNEQQKNQILNAAKLYGTKSISGVDRNEGEQITTITIEELKNSGYLDNKTVMDLNKKNDIEQCQIIVSWEKNQLSYKFEEKEGCPDNE